MALTLMILQAAKTLNALDIGSTSEKNALDIGNQAFRHSFPRDF